MHNSIRNTFFVKDCRGDKVKKLPKQPHDSIGPVRGGNIYIIAVIPKKNIVNKQYVILRIYICSLGKESKPIKISKKQTPIAM